MIREVLFKFVHGWRHHLPRSLYVAAVIASGVHILNNNNLPLELPATALLAGVAQVFEPESPATPDARKHMAVVEIDGDRFEDRYDRTSPLDRCKLLEDLKALLQNANIRVLAIDLDMSPTKPREYQEAYRSLERHETTLAELPRMHRCQYLLEEFLNDPLPQDPKRSLSIIAIAPLELSQGRDAALSCANPHTSPTSNSATPSSKRGSAWRTTTSFRRRVMPATGRCRLPNSSRGHCAKPAAPARQRTPRLPPGSVGNDAAGAGAVGRGLQDLCGVARRSAPSVQPRRPDPPDSPCFVGSSTDATPGRQPCDIRVVILGGTYGIEDQYLTPVGRMSGLQLHAVIAAQVRAHTPHWLSYLLDIAIGGIFFGPLVHWMWGGYYRQRTGTLTAGYSRGHPRTAYRWLVVLGLVYIVVVAFAAMASVWLYANGIAWISPVPKALAMLFNRPSAQRACCGAQGRARNRAGANDNHGPRALDLGAEFDAGRNRSRAAVGATPCERRKHAVAGLPSQRRGRFVDRLGNLRPVEAIDGYTWKAKHEKQQTARGLHPRARSLGLHGGGHVRRRRRAAKLYARTTSKSTCCAAPIF